MKKLGIIVAQEEEASPLTELLSRLGNRVKETTAYDEICLCISGVGKLNAMHAAYSLIHNQNVDIILNIGVSAGRGSLRVGDIVLVDRVYDGDFDISIFDHPKYYVPSVGDYLNSKVEGREVSVKTLPCFTVSKFLEGYIDTPIEDYVVDMEYYGIAYAGYRENIPTYSVKCISDTLLSNNDEEYEDNLDRCSAVLASFILNAILVP